jgi:hypothetical protein
MTSTKRQAYIPPPPGYRPWREAQASYEARTGRVVTKQRWHQLRESERVKGVWWDGRNWWGRNLEILPGKTVTGAPRSKGRKN